MAVISGTVTLTTAQQRKVHHLGVKVTVEEYIHFMDPYVPTRLKYVNDTIAQEDTVEGETVYPFRIPLSSLRKAAAKAAPLVSGDKTGEYPNLTHWLNSYTGNSFAIRHMLIVEVYRPWYTFNVYRYKNLSFQLMDEDNNQNHIQHPPSLAKSEQEEEADSSGFSLLPPHEAADMNRIVPETFHVDGLTSTGKCRVTLHSTHINLARSPLGYSRGGAAGDGAIIRGTLQLQDLQETIVAAKCMLLRAEFVGSKATHDALECEHLLFGVEEGESVLELEEGGGEDRQLRVPRSRGYVSRQDTQDSVVDSPRVTDPVRNGTSIEFEICLDGSGRDNDMNSCPSSLGEEARGSDGVTHHTRIQNALWQSLALQLNPTFYYLPLDLSKEPDDDDADESAAPSARAESRASSLEDPPASASASASAPATTSARLSHSIQTTASATASATATAPATASATASVTASAHHSSQAEIYSVASDESVCLRYYLRVVLVEKTGKKLWETVELVFYYSPHKEESLQKNCFLSARNNQEVTIIPPYLHTIESDELTGKNENV
jgi:hypothetical protein